MARRSRRFRGPVPTVWDVRNRPWPLPFPRRLEPLLSRSWLSAGRSLLFARGAANLLLVVFAVGNRTLCDSSIRAAAATNPSRVAGAGKIFKISCCVDGFILQSNIRCPHLLREHRDLEFELFKVRYKPMDRLIRLHCSEISL